MMGERTVMQEALFVGFSIERHVPGDHLLRKIDRFVDLSGVRAHLDAVLQRHRPALDRSGADDPDAAGGLLLRRPLRAAAVRGGPPQPGLSLVLPAQPRRRRAGPLDLLQEPPWPVPRQRSAAAGVRDRGRALHGRGAGGRRGLRGRRQHDRRRRPPSARRGGNRASWTRPRTGRSRSIWRFSTTRPSAARRRSSRSSSHPPIRPRAGPPPAAAPPFYAYADNYLIDLKHAVIMDVEATTAVRQAEVTAAKTMIDRTAETARRHARAPGRRHRLRLGRDARLAGR